MTVCCVRYRLCEDQPGHWRRHGPFEERLSAKDFTQVLRPEMLDLEEVKV